MNALFLINRYRIRVLDKTAIRIRSGPSGTNCGVLVRNSTTDVVIDRKRGWVLIPERDNAGLSLQQLQTHWDDLDVEIDVAHTSNSWTPVKDWSEVEFAQCL